MEKSRMRGLILGALSLSLLIAITLTAREAMAGTSLIEGDLHIEGDTVLRDGTWEVTGTVFVSNGTLTLENATLVMNSSSFYKNRIVVEVTGHLVARRSTIRGGGLGVCIEVLDDTMLENMTIQNMDVRYLGYGIYHEGGVLVIDNCTLIEGLNSIYSSSDLQVRSCSFSSFSGDAIGWYHQEDGGARGLVVEDSTFQNDKTQGTAMLLYGPYTLEPGWDATIRRCTFENLTYCIFANGFEEHGTLLIENNTAFGSASGLVLFWVGSSTTVRYNTWNMPMTATGVHIQLRGDGIPKVHNETILGGWYGMIVGGQHQRFEIRNITIEDVVSVGLMCYLVDLDIYDSYIKTLGHNFLLRGPTFIHIHDCDTGHSGVVQGTGEILELTEINITSVTWQEGTPIEEGIVVFETEEGFQLALRNNSAPSPLEFPMWVVREQFYLFVDEARGTHRQGDAVFYSDLFPLKGVESMALVIYDRLAPLLGVDNLTDGAKVREDSLLVGGTVVERGAGMGSVRVRCSGRDWEAASLSGDGTWRLTLTNLADGVVSVSVNATDRAGNSVQLEVRNITVDTVVPPIEVLGPPSHVRTTPAELLVRTEPGSTAHVNFRPVEVSEWGRFSTLIPLYEGENGVLIVVEDFAGNRNETTYMVYLDTRAPILLVSSPEEGEWTRGEPVWVNGTTEVGASVTVNGEPVELDHGAFSFPLSLEEGEVLLVITAVDLAGNVASVTRTVRVDRTPPTLEALEPGNGHVTNQRVLVVVGNATDASPVVVMVQGHPVAMVGPKWFKELLLAEGSNDIEVVAVDVAGNAATMHLEVVLDTVPPVVGVTVTVGSETFTASDGAIVTGEAEASFLFSADEDVTVEVAGGTPFPMEAGSLARRYLMEEGANRFTFVMRDEAGNDAGPFTFTIERDTERPELVVTYPIDGMVTREDQVLMRGFTEAGATLSIGGAIPIVFINGSFEALVPLSMGPNSIILEATDAANNTAMESVQVFREERENLKPDDSGIGIVKGAIGLLVGFLLTSAAIWMMRQNRKDGDMETLHSGESDPNELNRGSFEDERSRDGEGSGPG